MMMRDAIVIGTCETEAHAVVADVTVPIAPDLACATSHARVRWLLGRVGDVHQYVYMRVRERVIRLVRFRTLHV